MLLLESAAVGIGLADHAVLQLATAEKRRRNERHTKHEGGQQRSENKEENDEQDWMHGGVRNVPSHYTVLKLSVRWWRSNKWPQSSPLPPGVLFVLTTPWTVTDAPLWRWTSCSHIHNKFGPLGMCCLYTLAEWDCPQEGCGGVSGLVATCFLLLLAQKYPRLLDWDHSL